MAHEDELNDMNEPSAGATGGATGGRRRRATRDTTPADSVFGGNGAALDEGEPVVEGAAPWDQSTDVIGDAALTDDAAFAGVTADADLDTPILVGATDLELGGAAGDTSIATGSADALYEDDAAFGGIADEVPAVGTVDAAWTGGMDMGTTGSGLAGDVYGAYPSYAEDVTGAGPVTAGSEVVAVGERYDTAPTSRFVQVLRENPVPAGLIGLGLGWMLVKYLERFDTATAREALQDAQTRAREVASTAQETATQAVQGAQERAQDLADRVSTGVQDLTSRGDGTDSAMDATGTQGLTPSMADRAQDAVDSAMATTQGAVESATVTAQETADRVVTGVQQTADRVAETAQETADRVATTAQQAADRVATTAYQAADTIVVTTRDAGTWTVDTLQTAARRAQEEVGRTLRERPLAVEAIAVAAGAALALALPQLRQENEVMGEARDRVVARAGTAAEQVLNSIPVSGDGGNGRTGA